jgi:uncharacterized protein with HEPN domain
MIADRSVLDYLRDILDAIDKIVGFTTGLDYAEFQGDEKTQYAVVRGLKIIGEASKRIPGSMRKEWPAVPWREMAGMRDKLTHQYFGIDHGVIWKTIQKDVPELRPMIVEIIKALEAQSSEGPTA